MTSRYLRLSLLKFYMLLIGAVGLVLAYALPALKELAARSAYQHFVSMTAEKSIEAMTSAQINGAAALFERAQQYERNNPRWRTERGIFLHRTAAESQDPVVAAQREQRYQTAEFELQQAILRDPANGWNLYELGRLYVTIGASCDVNWQTCEPTRYFLAASCANPNHLPLRTRLALWLNYYNPDQAHELIHEALTISPASTNAVLEDLWLQIQDYVDLKAFLPELPEVSLAFSRFLFEHQRDYRSDLEAAAACADPNIAKQMAAWCRGTAFDLMVIHNHCTGLASLSRSTNGRDIELGNDDGEGDWEGYLAWEGFRIKKLFCLPANAAQYQYAAIKIFMRAKGETNFIADIFLDDTLIHRYENNVPPFTGWYEIPFHPSLLANKSHVAAYLRVHNASFQWKSLVVFGDQHAQRTYSSFSIVNRGASDDLSFEKDGEQTGEYLIRLVLKYQTP